MGKLSKQANILYSAAYHWWTGLPIVRMLHLMYLSGTAWVHYVQPSSATKTMHLRGCRMAVLSVATTVIGRKLSVDNVAYVLACAVREMKEADVLLQGKKRVRSLVECTDICPRPGDCLFLGHLPPSTTCASSGYG